MTSGRLGADLYPSYDDEFYGSRMQKLMYAGADRYLPFGQQELVDLAMSPLSDDDMVETFLGARNQDDFNSMRRRFESMEAKEQEAEFAALPPQTQQVLLESGYEPPLDEGQKSLIKRMVTWDIPLLPEEHFGPVIEAAASPARVLGFFAGKAVSGVWENLVMKPSRFATHWGRAMNYNIHSEKFMGPQHWGKIWEETQLEDDSYWQGTVNRVIDIVGDVQTEMLRLYARDGIKGVYEHYQKVGEQRGWSEIKVQNEFRNWYNDLANPDNQRALQVLNDNRLNLYTASIRNFNVASPWDVAPNSLAGKVVGTSGALITEILLDPTTWVGGAYIKIAKAAKAGIRGTQGRETIKYWKEVTRAAREDPAKFKRLVKRERFTPKAKHPTSHPAAALARTNWFARAQARAMNRFIDRVNAAFKQMDEIEDFRNIEKAAFRQAMGRDITDEFLDQRVLEKFGVTDALGALRRDIPHIDLALPHMKQWHYKAKPNRVVRLDHVSDTRTVQKKVQKHGEWVTEDVPAPLNIQEARELFENGIWGRRVDEVVQQGDEVVGIKYGDDLSSFDGYWEFLSESDEGWKTLASRVGNMDKDAIFLPRMGPFASEWARTKEWIRKPLDFHDIDLTVRADMGRLFASYLAKQTRYVHDKIVEDLANGTLKLSKDVIDQRELDELLQLSAAETGPDVLDAAKRMGYTKDDLNKLVGQREAHEVDAYQVILDDSELDELLRFYQNDGWEVRTVRDKDGKWRKRLVKKPSPFRGAQKAWKGAREDSYRKYIDERGHAPGSINDELTRFEKAGIITKQMVAAFGYYPARFAEKLTKYAPRGTHLDLQDTDNVIREFAALADMGIMADMPRAQIHQYIRRFIMSSEADRWRVQHDFFLDFLGRSGAFLYGGADVQKFIQRFIRHGHHAYANVADDVASLNGLGTHRAVHIGHEHSAQLAAGNIIPDYRELGAVSRYMAFYRTLGWGLHLPHIDKLVSRTWRPAVLLRLGYVPRNGGEELFSWFLREGPVGWMRQKLAKSALDMNVTFDEYGRKIRTLGKDMKDEDRRSLLISPFSRIWRSFNEVAGWGDNAVTAKAIKKAAEKNPDDWKWLSAEKRQALFEETREEIKDSINASLLSGTSLRMFEYAEMVSNKLTLAARDVFGTSVKGMPRRRVAAKWALEKLDRKGHEQRLAATYMSLTNPTLLDAHMKEVLGAFDTYLNFESSVDHALRHANAASDMSHLLRLPMDHMSAKLDWVALGNQNANSIDQSIAVAQRLHYLKDDPGASRYVMELLHYISDRREAVNAPIASRILNRDYVFRDRINAERQLREVTDTEVVAIWLKERHRQRSGVLNDAFDQALLSEQEVLDEIWIEALDSFAGDPDEDILRMIFEGHGGLADDLKPFRTDLYPELHPTSDVSGHSFSSVDDLPSEYREGLTVKVDPETGEPLYTNAFVRLDDTGRPVIYLNLAQIKRHYSGYGTTRPFERYRLWESGLGIDPAFVRANLEPGGSINLTARDLTNPDEFLRIVNEHLSGFEEVSGLGVVDDVLDLDSPLEGYLGHAALTWEHEMEHVRLGHPHRDRTVDDTAEAWRARELAVDSGVFNRLGIRENQLNPDASQVQLLGTNERYATYAGTPPGTPIDIDALQKEADDVAEFIQSGLFHEAGDLPEGTDYRAHFGPMLERYKAGDGPQAFTHDHAISEEVRDQAITHLEMLDAQIADAKRTRTGPAFTGPFVAADPNDVALLLMTISDNPKYTINPNRFTRSRDIASNRGRQAYVDYYLTPFGQQALRTAHGTNIGFDVTGGSISSPLPDNMARLAIPMLPIEYRESLIQMLSGGPGGRQDWFNDFVDILEDHLRVIGRDPAEATKVARLLHPYAGPHSTAIAPSTLLAESDHWIDLGEEYFPIAVGSGNHTISQLVSQSLEEVLIKRYGKILPDHKIAKAGHFGLLDVNADELLNKKFHNREGRPAGVDTYVVRGGLEDVVTAESLADAGQFGVMNYFFGFGEEGLQTAAQFGPHGLGHEPVIGIAGRELLDPTGGLRKIQMLDGNPDIYNVYIWRNKETGQYTVLRENDERSRSWFTEDLYERVNDEPMLVAGNDLHNAAEMFAFHNKVEIENILFNNARYEDEIFAPWAREVVHNEEVSPLRINTNAHRGDWWDQAPDKVLAHIPVTEEGGTRRERMNKAWNTVLRNWFDGIVNPMIGAVVREPLFQHYLVIGFEQTQDVRRLYHRPSKGINPADGSTIPFDERLAARSRLNRFFDDDDQLVVEEIEHFVKFNWPFAEADPEAVTSAFARAIQDGSNDDIVDALIKMVNDPEIQGNDVWIGLIDHLRVTDKELLNFAKKKYFEAADQKHTTFYLKKDLKPNGDPKPGAKKYKRDEIDRSLVQDLTDFDWKQTKRDWKEWNKSSLRGYMFNRKIQFEKHRDMATRRAMTLTGAYIDDHRIRSQFQEMVGTLVPFWFAEDNFLRRMGRGLKQNPMMFRNLHLTMNSGTYSGLIQEDQHGNQVLVIPGSEVATTYLLELADRFPVVNRVFGGPLGSIAAPKRLAMNVHVIPGYDIDQVGRMGFGPLASIPILYASGRDPDIRKNFENHMVGGRYSGMSRLESSKIEGVQNLASILYASAMPAIIKRGIDLVVPAVTSIDTAAHAKAKIDVIKFMAVNGQIPDEAEIAKASNPRLFEEEFFAKVDEMARQYLFLQSLTWFTWGSGRLEQMLTHESWEWNAEFHDLMSSGISYEEAYPLWIKNVEAATGEPFDPWKYSPFKEPSTEKIPFAVLETTQEANRWLVDNDEFVRSFTMGSAFFMPRKFDVEDDEYVWEAQARQLNLGLRRTIDDEEFVENLYSSVAGSIYMPRRVAYLEQFYRMKANGLDTTRLEAEWDTFSESFMEQHPSYAHTIVTGTAKNKREQTIHEFRLLQAAPHLIPDTIHKQDLMDAMATILTFHEKFTALAGSNNTQKRDALRQRYYEGMRRFVEGKPWLNELYYSVFIPLISDSWLGKYNAGLKGGTF